jgi:cleavage and polyadenylation specificity factor subunit 1
LNIVLFEAIKLIHILILDEGIGSNHKIPEIRVDPEGRCAALLIFRNTLAILPFRKDSAHDNNVTLSSYIIKLTDLEERVDNVIDVQFLHGYYEPTLIILYEPVGTFPGRIAVRQDTCNMVAVSLNTQQRVHPIIWSLNSLPFDCSQLLPVPKPLGGALILAVNSIIYVNQSVPPYGVSVNSIADHCTSFPLSE